MNTPDDYVRAASKALAEAAALMANVQKASDRKEWAETDGLEALRLVRQSRIWISSADRDLGNSIEQWRRQPAASFTD